jgi:hypothetical protein
MIGPIAFKWSLFVFLGAIIIACRFSRDLHAQQSDSPNRISNSAKLPSNSSSIGPLRKGTARSDSAPAAIDLNVFAAQIAGEMRSNSNLRGAWLFVEADDQRDPGVAVRIFHFRRVFDKSRSSLQWHDMERFIRSRLPAGNYRINPAQDFYLPVSELFSELRDRLDIDPKFSGAMISGVYFAESKTGGSLNLVLCGRLTEESKVEQIERLCAQIMARNPVWSRAGIHPSTESKDDLVVDPASEPKAGLFFAEGLQDTWKFQYQDASRAFQQATLESPLNLQYHYWRVVSDLSLGNRQRAAVRMENVVRTFGVEALSQQRPAIYRSLERIQGPMRRELRGMEMQAALQVSRAAKVVSQ